MRMSAFWTRILSVVSAVWSVAILFVLVVRFVGLVRIPEGGVGIKVLAPMVPFLLALALAPPLAVYLMRYRGHRSQGVLLAEGHSTVSPNVVEGTRAPRTFLRWGIAPAFVVGLVIVVVVLGHMLSGGKISDSDLASQVKQYLRNENRECFMRRCQFVEYFNVLDVVVRDKLVKDKELTAICDIFVRVSKNYDADSGVTMAYASIVGEGPGIAGNSRRHDTKFLFEKYESGWRIKGEDRGGLFR